MAIRRADIVAVSAASLLVALVGNPATAGSPLATLFEDVGAAKDVMGPTPSLGMPSVYEPSYTPAPPTTPAPAPAPPITYNPFYGPGGPPSGPGPSVVEPYKMDCSKTMCSLAMTPPPAASSAPSPTYVNPYAGYPAYTGFTGSAASTTTAPAGAHPGGIRLDVHPTGRTGDLDDIRENALRLSKPGS
jgi:hypothetical protein